MPILGFKNRFRDPIEERTKRQTLRSPRKYPIVAGDKLYLYTGLRTKHSKIIGTATCVSAPEIRLDFENRRVESETGMAYTTEEETDAFAKADGFTDWEEMKTFWAKEHPGLKQWSGTRIIWGDTLVLPADG